MTNPKTRADCPQDRPCLFFTCRYNLTVDPDKATPVDENDIPLSINVLTLIDTDTQSVRRLPIICEQSLSNCALDYGRTDHRSSVRRKDLGYEMSVEEIAEATGLTVTEVHEAIQSSFRKLMHYSAAADLLEMLRDFQTLNNEE